MIHITPTVALDAQQLSLLIKDDTGSIKNQLVLPTHEIDVGHDCAAIGGTS